MRALRFWRLLILYPTLSSPGQSRRRLERVEHAVPQSAWDQTDGGLPSIVVCKIDRVSGSIAADRAYARSNRAKTGSPINMADRRSTTAGLRFEAKPFMPLAEADAFQFVPAQ